MILTRLWKNQPGDYFALSLKTNGKWEGDTFFSRSELHKVCDFIKENGGSDIYFCPHGFERKRRIKANAVAPKLLWSDMDSADPHKVKPRPTIAIESSPGRYVGLWITDRATTEELNRRLAYSIGGDVSGWDLTQVLRVPGTINYKYDSMPRTRLLWCDGPSYTVDELNKMLPVLDDQVEVSDGAQAYQRWEKKLPHHVRRELMTRRVPESGKRSEVLFKLINELVEAGVSREDGIAMVRASVWNKFAGRYSEAKQLNREWDKATNKHLGARRQVAGESDSGEESHNDYVFLSRSLADVEEKDIEWVWYPYLARGEITILQGDPGAGKSWIAQNVAGHLIDGKELPSTIDVPVVRGSVAYFDLENSAGHVTRKRMKWCGYKHLDRFYQEEEPFSVGDVERMEFVREGLKRMKNLSLIVFDTLNTYIGRVDTFAGAESQQAFIQFKRLAVEFNVPVLVLRHLTKGSKEKAMYRGQGNIAFTGIARVEITAGAHPTIEDVRVLTRSKGNLTKEPPALKYEIRDMSARGERDQARFVFGGFDESVTADDVVSAPPKEKGSATKDAMQFLTDLLKNGHLPLRDLYSAAEGRSISRRTLQRVMDEAGVNKFRESGTTYVQLG